LTTDIIILLHDGYLVKGVKFEFIATFTKSHLQLPQLLGYYYHFTAIIRYRTTCISWRPR